MIVYNLKASLIIQITSFQSWRILIDHYISFILGIQYQETKFPINNKLEGKLFLFFTLDLALKNSQSDSSKYWFWFI